MFYYIIMFSMLAILLPIMGFGLIGGILWEVAKILVIIFVIGIIIKFVRDITNCSSSTKL